MKESDLKRTVDDYLQYKMNAGELYFDRLNSGSAFVGTPQHPRRIKLCREGTADFIVLMIMHLGDGVHHTRIPAPRIVFLELKSVSGRQSPEQKEFEYLVVMQGAEYFIIRSIEELENLL